ncbi:MAG: cytochrome c biogenesis protein CcsA [Betaproteobacteria bacterium]
MILLHLVASALYAAAAWALWPGAGASERLKRALPPAAIAVHAIAAGAGIATPQGLDLSLPHALSLVALLSVLVAWLTGALSTLPGVGAVVLPVAALAALVPALVVSPHRFPYSGETLATAHIAVALFAYAFFIVAAAQALVMTGLESRLHRGLPAGAATPPLLTLERTLFRLIGIGFALLSLALASGVLFSEQVFGRAFQFTHKNVFAVASWLVFGALVVGRWRYGWRGRQALRWILSGTALLILAYLGSKFVLEVVLGR